MTETGFNPAEDLPVYVISVAAELAGLHAQTLRAYDRLGLVVPGRAPGGGRRYSARDIALLREVQRLSTEGVNLEGIRRVLDLEDEVGRLRGASPSWRPSAPAAPSSSGAPRRAADRHALPTSPTGWSLGSAPARRPATIRSAECGQTVLG